MLLDNKYWENRYLTNDTAWDIGKVSTPLKEYFTTLTDKNIKILIPGAGNAYEAEYLFANGFKNVTVIDFASAALANLKKRLPNFSSEQLICADFFEHTGKYDLIVEQTFFCAIYPTLRKKYVHKMTELLSENGLLVGVLFNDTLNIDKPPFGGNSLEYKKLFDNYFVIEKLEKCYNSILPRKDREVFIKFRKKVKRNENTIAK